jgi:hypothetical protein
MAESDDLRTFIRELLLRFDRKWEIADAESERRFARASEERRRYFESLRAAAEEDARRTDDIIAENRAQRAALLSILDEMRGRGGTAPAS